MAIRFPPPENYLRQIDNKFHKQQLTNVEEVREQFENKLRHCRLEIEAELQKTYYEKVRFLLCFHLRFTLA